MSLRTPLQITTVCDNAASSDEQYLQCDELIPATEEEVIKGGKLTLECDLQSTSQLPIRCIWRLPESPDGITECEVCWGGISS